LKGFSEDQAVGERKKLGNAKPILKNKFSERETHEKLP
jgi:hypothetical protein